MILLIILLIFSTTIFIYYLPDLNTYYYKKIKEKDINSFIEDKVILMASKSKRTKEILPKINKMLKASSFRIKDKPLKIHYFLLICFILGLMALYLGIKILNNFTASIILFIVCFSVPYYVLLFNFHFNRDRIKKQTSNFLLTMSNLFSIYQDPIIALEEIAPRLKNPLKREVEWFVDSIKFGNSIDNSLHRVRETIPDVIIKEFFDDVAFYLKYGGNFNESILELIKRAYHREMSEMERSAKTFSTIMIFIFLIGVYFFIMGSLINTKPEMMAILVKTPQGKMLVVIMILIFIVAALFTKAMIKVEEDE